MSNTTPEQLRTAITEMDGMAQSGFSQIAAIARLALAALETPSAYTTNTENIACALQTISGIAFDIENCINCSAEAVGCNYKDEALERRYAARRLAHESGRG